MSQRFAGCARAFAPDRSPGMDHHTPTLLAAVVIGAMLQMSPSVAMALTCRSAGGWSDVDGGRIGIVIETDFAAELRGQTSSEGTPTPDDDALTELQVRNFILQMAETWNLETRGRTIHLRGYGDYETNEDFCDAWSPGTNETLLYVHYEQANTGNGAAVVKKINANDPDCENKRELAVYEDFPDGSGRYNYKFGSIWDGNGSLLTTIMTHEFGHVVGLGHAHLVGECRSVMAYHNSGSGCSTFDDGGRHPLNWDKDCIDASTHPREFNWEYQGWDGNGVLDSAGAYAGTLRKRFMGAQAPRSSAGSRYYVTYDGFLSSTTKTRAGFVGIDGYVPLNTQTSMSSAHSDLFELDEPPHISRGLEYSYSTEPLRITFLDDENDSSPNTWYNPPYVQFIRTNYQFSGSPLTSDTTLNWCTHSSCSHVVRSHVPIVSTWNPQDGGDTITAWVRTTSLDGNDGEGNIQIHPAYQTNSQLGSGYHTTSSLQYFMPTGYAGYDYSHESDFAPAIACADSWEDAYNCIAVWLDKGVFNGSVLYAFFAVSGDVVYWTQPVRRFSSFATSSPAAAYFNGEFRVAWIDPTGPYLRVYKSDTPGTWALEKYTYEPWALGSPTFLAEGSGYESVLLWAHAD